MPIPIGRFDLVAVASDDVPQQMDDEQTHDVRIVERKVTPTANGYCMTIHIVVRSCSYVQPLIEPN
ncbi:MAG: hypothetical protein AAFN70_14650 [Planctomycetota bacterium]